jgi:hypothetical protein
MVAFGISTRLLLLLVFSLGQASSFQTDFLAIVPTEEYLQARQIELRADKLIEIAKSPPRDARGLATQLLAIRWFAENKDKLGEHAKAVKETLQTLSQGQQGFAKDYAQISLAAIEGRAPPILQVLPKGSVRSQAFEWFPDDATLVGAIDLRTPATSRPDAQTHAAASALHRRFLGIIPPQAMQGLFGLADQIGNFRIDRVAFAYMADPAGRNQQRMFVRITGEGNAKHLHDLIKGNVQNARVEERKGPNGVTMRVISQGGPGPIFMFPVLAFVGDCDLLICGFEGGENPNHLEVFEQAVAVMGGKKPSVARGPFGPGLQTTSEDARALVFGSLPDELRKELNRGPLGVSPLSVAADITSNPDGKGNLLSVRASFGSEADASKFADGIQQLLKAGAEALKALPFKLTPEALAALDKALAAVEIKADKSGIAAKIPLAPATIQALGELLEAAMKTSR